MSEQYILALDSSTKYSSIGIFSYDSNGRINTLISSEKNSGGKHSEILAFELSKMLDNVNLKPKDLSFIAIGVGPGSFTGLRSGVSLAKGIAFGANIPLIGVSSLKALALNVDISEAGNILSVIDARHNELFIALYEKKAIFNTFNKDLLVTRLEPQAVAPKNLFSLVTTSISGEVYLSGPDLSFFDEIENNFKIGSNLPPMPYHLAFLAYEKYLAKDFTAVAPVYIRPPDIFKK